jgi:hypothetical protein
MASVDMAIFFSPGISAASSSIGGGGLSVMRKGSF